ncbi:MAG: NAD(P)-dependent oxidoreductase [Parvularculaceae bacterium]|nr:NAD(P)-dependent oxidoreductase [Parvularculaceae bacterium]
MSAGAGNRVLVTGATGFIGRHSLQALRAKGFQVIGVSRSGADGIACDLLNPDAVRKAVSAAGASHLLHLAWHDDPRERWRAPENLDWVGASLSLARAFASAGGRRFIFGGSSAQYAWRGERLSEQSEQTPSSLYGAAKAATEGLLFSAASVLGISVASARIFFCYGPGEPAGRLVSDIIAKLSAGEEAPCTDGLQKRDYLHVADIAEALAVITASDVTGPVNVASGEAIPVKALALETAQRLGRPELLRLGAVARSENEPAIVEANIARLSALGFQPRHTIESGVADTVTAHSVNAHTAGARAS